jgi:hypothetical protein
MRGALLGRLKRFDEALRSFNQAIALEPDNAEARRRRGCLLLLHGDFDNGLADLEWRWLASPRPRLPYPKRRQFAQPLWLGKESIAGKTVLLYGWGGGLGDIFQFCRYAKLAADRGARVILEIDEPLVRLLAALEGVSQIVAQGAPLPDFDFHCPLLSAPLAFKTNLRTVPASVPYLRGESGRVACWQARLGPRTKLRVGLAWISKDPDRGIPLHDLIEHLPVGPQYISLQNLLRQSDWEAIRANPTIMGHFGDEMDFVTTSAVMECMDLIISVDTSLAHLAGALGRPTWILLPYLSDWRWLLDRDDSPWYPTARLYRQTCRNDWRSVLERVHADLKARGDQT